MMYRLFSKQNIRETGIENRRAKRRLIDRQKNRENALPLKVSVLSCRQPITTA
jgi:hypothetical protein